MDRHETSPCAAERPMEIQSELSKCEGQLNALHDSLRQLETRLTSVVRGEPPNAPNSAKEAPERIPSTTLGGKINSISSGIKVVNEGITSLLRKLEL